MRVVALVSGGKDSCFAMWKCVHEYHHEIAAIASLIPPSSLGSSSSSSPPDEIDSYMFQTIGHQVLPMLAKCMGNIPFHSHELTRPAKCTDLDYHHNDNDDWDDEVEDLYELLSTVIKADPTIKAVCSGAIESNYQRLRIEHIASRLSLLSIAPLWQQSPSMLLTQMIDIGMEAIIIKVASMGLTQHHIGRIIDYSLYKEFCDLRNMYGIHICGEGGEYESLTLDSPLFKKRLIIEDSEIIKENAGNDIAPVCVLRIKQWKIQDKENHHLQSNGRIDIVNSDDDSLTHTRALPVTTSIPISTADSTNTTSSFPRTWLSSSPSCSSLSSLFPPIRIIGDIAFISYIHTDIIASSTPIDQLDSIFRSHLAHLPIHSFAISNIIFIHLSLPSMSDFVTMNSRYSHHIPLYRPPSRATLQLPGLPHMNADMLLYRGLPDKQVLHVQSVSSWAPACIGPYSQATSIQGIVFLAGQIGLIPETMILPTDERQQIRQAWQNCQQVLTSMRSDTNNILFAYIYINSRYHADLTAITHLVLEETHHRLSLSAHQYILLYVSDLPRAAIVEIQLVTYQHGLFEPKYSHIAPHTSSLSSALTTSAPSILTTISPPSTFVTSDICYVADSFLSSSIRLQICIDGMNVNNTIDIRDLLHQCIERLIADAQAAELSVNHLCIVRVYYVFGLDIGHIEEGLYEAFVSYCGTGNLPAVSFLPVVALDAITSDPPTIVTSMLLHAVFWNMEV